jgi:hypothetical protein
MTKSHDSPFDGVPVLNQAGDDVGVLVYTTRKGSLRVVDGLEELEEQVFSPVQLATGSSLTVGLELLRLGSWSLGGGSIMLAPPRGFTVQPEVLEFPPLAFSTASSLTQRLEFVVTADANIAWYTPNSPGTFAIRPVILQLQLCVAHIDP